MLQILCASGLCTRVKYMSLLLSTKIIFLSLAMSIWFKSISQISVECSINCAEGLPDTMSKMRTILGLVGSMIASTSLEIEMWRLFKNSTLSPWYFGELISLPS